MSSLRPGSRSTSCQRGPLPCSTAIAFLHRLQAMQHLAVFVPLQMGIYSLKHLHLCCESDQRLTTMHAPALHPGTSVGLLQVHLPPAAAAEQPLTVLQPAPTPPPAAEHQHGPVRQLRRPAGNPVSPRLGVGGLTQHSACTARQEHCRLARVHTRVASTAAAKNYSACTGCVHIQGVNLAFVSAPVACGGAVCPWRTQGLGDCPACT